MAIVKYKNCFLKVDISLLNVTQVIVPKGTFVQIIGEWNAEKICVARIWTRLDKEEPEFDADLFEKCVFARRAALAPMPVHPLQQTKK